MKNIICFAALIFCLSCSKDKIDSPSDLNGSWRLIEVLDKTTNETTYPPAEDDNDLVIKFTGITSFEGHTLRNTITDGVYELTDENKITFRTFSTSKVMEDFWGSALQTSLSACLLSSTFPCPPSDLELNGSTLEIKNGLRYNLKFRKL